MIYNKKHENGLKLNFPMRYSWNKRVAYLYYMVRHLFMRVCRLDKLPMKMGRTQTKLRCDVYKKQLTP
jgi:hypothetical protein